MHNLFSHMFLQFSRKNFFSLKLIILFIYFRVACWISSRKSNQHNEHAKKERNESSNVFGWKLLRKLMELQCDIRSFSDTKCQESFLASKNLNEKHLPKTENELHAVWRAMDLIKMCVGIAKTVKKYINK